MPLKKSTPTLKSLSVGARFQKNKIIVILGPTASRKSNLAVKIAEKFNGEVISADSRQVYKGLDIGTGKVPRDKISNYPACAEASAGRQLLITNYYYKGIPHYLIDVASPKKTFTVAKYQKLARKTIRKIWQRNKLPILCGGTGFYIDALLYGYNLPAVPPNLKLRRKLEKKSALELFLQLKKLDPRRAKNIDRYNKRRLVRALEIVLTSGKIVPLIPAYGGQARLSASGGNKRYSFGKNYDVLKIGLTLGTEELKTKIKKRLVKRIKHGMINEVDMLHNPPAGGGLSWKRLDSFGLEYRWISRYLQGALSKDETIKKLTTEIWHYAKRQMTWFKRDKRIRWIKTGSEAEKLTKEFLK